MADISKFDEGTGLWAEYSDSAKGLLREEIIWFNLERALPSPAGGGKKPRALDAGCGAGGIGIRLALAGFEAVLMDASPRMLAEAKRRAAAQGASVELCCAHLEEAIQMFPAGTFSLVACHSVIEYVDEPGAILLGMANLLAEKGRLSLVAKNRCGETLHQAILRCDIEGARRALDRAEFKADMFGLKGRAYSPGELKEMASAAGLSVMGVYGVRAVADFIPDEKKREPLFFRELLDLEKRLSSMSPYSEIARYAHLICAKPGAER